VNQVYPDLVIRDEARTIQGVRYDEFAPLLLSEVQQQQRSLGSQANLLAAQDQRLRAQNQKPRARDQRLGAQDENSPT
jgi:hypothetical protein